MSNLIYALVLLFSMVNCSATKSSDQIDNKDDAASAEKHIDEIDLSSQSTAVFASGCFWCVEAVFESVDGVSEAISGYAGGSSSDANYKAVSAGRTDHAEAVEVYYNPEVVSYETLLKVFFGSQDPTTLNQQGLDKGRQYRSAIFYANNEEKKAAQVFIGNLIKNKVYDGDITTTLEPLTKFYPAEDYHQDYERRNPNQGYVKAVSVPRLNRFKAKFPELLKKGVTSH